MPWLRGGMSWNIEDETFSGNPAVPTLGNTEDVTRDRPAGFHQRPKRRPARGAKWREDMDECKDTKLMECWSLNTGGNSGVWRTINVLEGLPAQSRPKLIHLQETSCDENQWKTLERFFKTLGYRAFHVMGTADSKPTHGAWKRGIITAVSESLCSKWIGDHSWKQGQYLALDVNGVLCVNSYTRPEDASIQTHLGLLGEFLTQLHWEGRILMGGDWNEVWPESWIESLTGLFGCGVQDCSNISTTRWDGPKTIDYWISNGPLAPASVGEEKISDHKVVITKFDFGKLQDPKYVRFVQEKQFRCPDWISVGKWHVLFREAFQLGARLDWEDAIKQVEQMDWDNDIDEQGIINYQWALACAKLTWSFSVAASAALLHIPEGYSNFKEILYVESMANHYKIKGVSVRLQHRHLQKVAMRASESLRKLYKKEGRLHELRRRFRAGKLDAETANLTKKTFPGQLVSEVNLEEIEHDLQHIHSLIKKREAQDKEYNLKSWKKRMQSSLKARGSWINKQGLLLSPTVKDEQCAQSRQQGAKMIHTYWQRLWSNQSWTQEERLEKVNQVVSIINQKMEGTDIQGRRPDLSEFQAALRRISGTHGIDGWSHAELRAISSVKDAAALLWDEMAIWEEVSLIPSSVAHCKLVCIPKKDKRELSPREFRPICVMSSLWRAWSSTWIRSKLVSSWTSHLFPPFIAGGIPGSLGPETLAAMVDHELHKHKFGASFDFKHAFDCVDLELLHLSLQQVLPHGLRQWESLLHHQWKAMSRWIVFDGCVHPHALSIPRRGYLRATQRLH